jgi:hypothetical protein
VTDQRPRDAERLVAKITGGRCLGDTNGRAAYDVLSGTMSQQPDDPMASLLNALEAIYAECRTMIATHLAQLGGG